MRAQPVPAAPPLNRLAREKSPYLAQHARNPVEWYPWGQEAFDKARSENKPIFLSIGYSTCHWCHVMAHESFENEAIARLLSRDFVSIKVDREERPDLDRLYMAYVHALTGSGGWPMSVWLTPELKPFFGGTYFPPEDRFGRPGFGRLLAGIAEVWRTSREQLEEAGEIALSQLQHVAAAAERGARVTPAWLDVALQRFQSSYDAARGGFGGPPKFPRASTFAFLLRHHARTGEPKPVEMTLNTLRLMANGGFHDHLGGGFHRYATDADWLIPHFEKMLYDQAQLACCYLEAYQVTGEALMADTARAALEYVRRDLTGPSGQFYAAEDADSAAPGPGGERAEGVFYTWTSEEARAVLGDEEARRFIQAFGLERGDNAVEGRHVLAVSSPEAAAFRRSPAWTELQAARARRPRPHLDDKAVTAWNGLALSAFARAYQVLGEPADRASAERAARFARRHLYNAATGRLYRRYRDGESAGEAFAEDYAFLIQGLLDLYEAVFDPWDLEWALELQERQNALFWDDQAGGYFSSAAEAPDVLVRLKEREDGAEPSANSVSASNLLRLSAITGSADLRRHAETLLKAFGKRLREVPESLPQMLAALALAHAEPCQIVIAGKRDAEDTRALLSAAQRPFLPFKTLLLADGGAGQRLLAKFQPALRDLKPQRGRAAAYVCDRLTCRAPVLEPDALAALLR